MKYSFQVPIPRMDEFIEDQDFFFALAHHVIMSKEYSDWFLNRLTVMDNGVHEMGEPISMASLIEAADLCQAYYIIPPDYMYNSLKTLEAFEEAKRIWGADRLWPVAQGKTFDDIDELIQEYSKQGVAKICLPYRLGLGVRMFLMYKYYKLVKFHLLSVKRFDELYSLRMFPDVSIDTGKPFRWAQMGLVWTEHYTTSPEELPKLDMSRDFYVSHAKQAIQEMKEVTEFVR